MGTVTDLTTRAATLDELRRRALEGDQQAAAEISRRRAEEEYRLRQRRKQNRRQVALDVADRRPPGRVSENASKVEPAVSRGATRGIGNIAAGVRVA